MEYRCWNCGLEFEHKEITAEDDKGRDLCPACAMPLIDCYNLHFLDDEEKMVDFPLLTKEEFLASYSYLTEDEYDATLFLFNKGVHMK